MQAATDDEVVFELNVVGDEVLVGESGVRVRPVGHCGCPSTICVQGAIGDGDGVVVHGVVTGAV